MELGLFHAAHPHLKQVPFSKYEIQQLTSVNLGYLNSKLGYRYRKYQMDTAEFVA